MSNSIQGEESNLYYSLRAQADELRGKISRKLGDIDKEINQIKGKNKKEGVVGAISKKLQDVFSKEIRPLKAEFQLLSHKNQTLDRFAEEVESIKDTQQYSKLSEKEFQNMLRINLGNALGDSRSTKEYITQLKVLKAGVDILLKDISDKEN